MFYSKTTGGFYSLEIHGTSIPEDAVSISSDFYQKLLAGQEDGKQIKSDENGNPFLIDQPDLTYAQKRVAEYPSISDQLDMQYWDSINKTTKWKDSISSIKDKYPKS